MVLNRTAYLEHAGDPFEEEQVEKQPQHGHDDYADYNAILVQQRRQHDGGRHYFLFVFVMTQGYRYGLGRKYRTNNVKTTRTNEEVGYGEKSTSRANRQRRSKF